MLKTAVIKDWWVSQMLTLQTKRDQKNIFCYCEKYYQTRVFGRLYEAFCHTENNVIICIFPRLKLLKSVSCIKCLFSDPNLVIKKCEAKVSVNTISYY